MYEYEALSSQGSTTGQVVGESPRAVADALLERGFYATRIERARIPTRAQFRLGAGSIGGGKRAEFVRQLGALLNGGLTMEGALSLLLEQSEDAGLSSVLERAKQAIRDGDSLAIALGREKGFLSPQSLGSIKAGEAAGSLPETLDSIATLLEQDEATVRQVRDALAYPSVIVIAGCATLALLFLFVIPRLTLLYTSIDQTLPLATRILVQGSEFLRASVMPIAVVVLALSAAAWYRARRSRALQFRLWNFCHKLPVLGRALRQKEVVHFSRGLAVMLKGGVPMSEALALLAQSAGNPYSSRSLAAVVQDVLGGRSLAEALSRERMFRGTLVSFVSVGEADGQLPEALNRGAQLYAMQLETQLRTATKMIEPTLILLLGICVAFIVFSMMMPILHVDLGY